MLGNMIANMMVKPYQSPLFDHPSNYGLNHEDVTFVTRDGVVIKGWLIEGGCDKVIVQTHFGVQCNRAGYCPEGKGLIKPWKKNICFLRQAAYFAQQGYSVLMYDLRGHGASGIGINPWISWGPVEALDVIAAVDYISSRPEFAEASIGLMSICMGAASTTYAYGMSDGLTKRANIKAMIAVQPLLYSYFVNAFGMPGFVQRAARKVTSSRLGFDLNEKSFIPHAIHISVPTMVVQNRNDPWTNLEMVNNYFENIGVEKSMKWLEIEKNRFAAYNHIGEAPEEYADWFARHM